MNELIINFYFFQFDVERTPKTIRCNNKFKKRPSRKIGRTKSSHSVDRFARVGKSRATASGRECGAKRNNEKL